MEKTAAALAKLVAKGGRTLPKDVGLDLGTAQPLVEQGLVEIVIEGKRRLVAITDKGREEAAKAPPPPPRRAASRVDSSQIDAKLDEILARLARIEAALGAATPASSPEERTE